MKYRDHTGSLAESMATVREVSSKQDIINHLNEFYKDFGKEVEEIQFNYACYDKRVDWDTYYVMHRLKGEKEFLVAGMSDGRLYDTVNAETLKKGDKFKHNDKELTVVRNVPMDGTRRKIECENIDYGYELFFDDKSQVELIERY